MANAGVMTGADSLLFIDVLLMYCLMGISQVVPPSIRNSP